MEFALLPIHRGDPAIPIPRTPYVAAQRYDGGSWLTYPERKGKLKGMLLENGQLDMIEYSRTEQVQPTSIEESIVLPDVVIFWTYCGGVNSTDASFTPISPNPVLDHLYNALLVDDEKYIRLTKDNLDEFLVMGRAKMPPDPEERKVRCEHLKLCLSYAHSVWFHATKGFDHQVRYSIAALGEVFMFSINFASERVGLPGLGRDWTKGFYDEKAKAQMRAHGWCPSDIARAESKYPRIQTLYISLMMDRSFPPRDHSRCTATACNLYQINNRTYKEQHQEEGCDCEQLIVKEEDLRGALFKEDSFPCLRLKGDLHNLTYEIVELGTAPYIAISHVWADGLGNPHVNALHRCKLHRLRELVNAIEPMPTDAEGKGPLIWLDTLCCPAKNGPGKQIAIEKIRLVYQRAKHVLVLDAGLMAYEARGQDATEVLVRIFTSSWMRRLWTLQEGALAKSLYFQFADIAQSLMGAITSVYSMKGTMTYRAVFEDALAELLGLIRFFNSRENGLSEPSAIDLLKLLDRALQFRSVSIASDEPLCIGTLMGMDLSAILQLKTQEDRMRKVWELIALQNAGIPAQVLYLEEERLGITGFKWAPKSLLNSVDTSFTLYSRVVRWADTQLGQITPQGLRVQYPGYRISVKTAQGYGDGRPKNPWPGMPRIPEDWLPFKDKDTGKWYRIVDKRYVALDKTWKTDAERKEYQELGLFPLHDVVHGGDAVIIFRLENEIGEGLLATIQPLPLSLPEKSTPNIDPKAIAVTTENHILIQQLRSQSYIYDVISRLALELRKHELTDRHVALYERLQKELNHEDSTEDSEGSQEAEILNKISENEEFRESISSLRDKMKEVTKEVIGGDERFRDAVRSHFGEAMLEDIWVLIRDWFWHDCIAERIGDEDGDTEGKGQVWIVD